jgi:hypothetical protein
VWLPLAILIASWAAVYLPHLVARETLPARDVGTTQIPWRTVWRAQVLAGSPPLWDPYSNGGRPLLADPNTMAAYPGTLLFLFASPEAAAAWQIALTHLVLILGCYLLARRSGATRGGASVAAAAVGTCGVAWSAVTFLNVQASLACGMLALATAVPPPASGGAATRRGLAAGALVGLAFLGGDPITAALAAAAWIAVALASWRPVPVRPVLAMAGAAVAAAAPVLVPLLTIYPDTVRGAMPPAPGSLSADALAPRRLPELLFPNLLGAPLGDVGTGFWAAPSFPWPRYYPLIFVGLVPLLVLPFARLRGWRLAPWGWVAAAGVAGAAVLAVPEVADRVQALPLLASTRYAIRLLVLPVLAMPPLVAAGWEEMAKRWPGAGRRAVRTAVVGLVLVAPLAASPRLLRPALAALYPASASALAGVPASTLRRSALTDWGTLALPAAALAVAGPLPAVAVPAIVAANVLGGSGVLLFEDDAAWAAPPPVRTALPARPVVAALEPPHSARAGGPRAAIARYWGPHEALDPQSGTRWGVSYVLTRGPDGLEPIAQELLAGAAEQMPAEAHARLARAVGATAVLARGPVPGWPGEIVGDTWVGTLEHPSPPAYLARRLLPAEGLLAAATTMAAPGFRAGIDAVVAGVGPARDAAGGEVVERPGAPHRRTFEITANGAGLLVVPQSFMRCWRATVDGAPAKVEAANGAELGVPVPGGPHRVVLFLDPTPYRLGLLGPFLLIVAAVLSRRGRTSPARAGASGDEGRSIPATASGRRP